jgi:CelD/BcsL family acetyltransferase involved in cellulose biosynthesis
MIDVVTDRAGVLRLAEAWTALVQRAPDPFQRHDCALASLDAFGGTGRPRVYVLRQGGDVRAVIPFRTVRRGGVTRLEALSRVIAEPSGLPHANPDALAELMEAVLADRRPLMLGRMTRGGAELAALDRALDRRPPLGTSGRADRSVWVPLPEDADALVAGMSANRRRDVRRKWRRAEQHGPVAFSCVQPDAGEAPAVLEAAYRIEAASWKGRNGTAMLMAPDYRRFYDAFSVSLAREGRLFVFFLKIGGQPAAMRITASWDNRLWELKIGYDERFQECSPGFLLTHETLRWASDRDLTAYEFLGQAEEWEFAWKAHARDYGSVNVHPRSMSGAMALAQDRGWEAAKAGLRRARLDREARKARARQGAGSGTPAEKPGVSTV